MCGCVLSTRESEMYNHECEARIKKCLAKSHTTTLDPDIIAHNYTHTHTHIHTHTHTYTHGLGM